MLQTRRVDELDEILEISESGLMILMMMMMILMMMMMMMTRSIILITARICQPHGVVWSW